VVTGRRLEQLRHRPQHSPPGRSPLPHPRDHPGDDAPRWPVAEAGIELAETDRILADVVARQTTAYETARACPPVPASIPTARSTTPPPPAVDAPWLGLRRPEVLPGRHLDPSAASTCTPPGGDHERRPPAGDTRSHTPHGRGRHGRLAGRSLDGCGTARRPRGVRPHVPGDEIACRPWARPRRPGVAERAGVAGDVSRPIDGAAAGLRRRRRPGHHRPRRLPLDVGRSQRTASAAIRRAVEIRDGTASSPAATPLPEWCDVHMSSTSPLGIRRADLLRQRRAALRAAPHRLSRGGLRCRPRSRNQSLAHVPPRRHRDPQRAGP
jgi:hypothetical protein